MVREEQFEPRDELEPIGRITLKPNQSLSWKTLRIFLFCFALFSGSIAMAFLFLGYWIILPLAGAEFLIVSLCLWLCLKRCAIQEVITFSKSRIKIEKDLTCHPRAITGRDFIQSFSLRVRPLLYTGIESGYLTKI